MLSFKKLKRRALMNQLEKLKGVFPVLLTPFKDDESIDEKKLRDEINFELENGVDGVVACGSTGEFIAMTLEERKKVLEIVMDEVNGRVPVIAGTGHYNTKICIEMSQHAQELGAAAVMTINPYYYQPPTHWIMNHYRDLGKNLDIPVMVYNNPWFSGVELSDWEVATLVEEGAVSAIKSAMADPARCHNLKRLCGDKLRVFYGHELNTLEALLIGAEGWITAVINVLPRLSKDLYIAAVEEKNVEKASKIWDRMLPLIHFCHLNVPACKDGRRYWLNTYKEAMEIIGHSVGIPRRPVGKLGEEDRATLERILKNIL
ncbi:MAG: hypothetical protein DRP89_06065 [Candidatus Neomarinimicrobiota bacterium]|nr:MAG: hypothetical protein DRP89_06065 [Candidatus Neomarinimicrobiota bacterium]